MPEDSNLLFRVIIIQPVSIHKQRPAGTLGSVKECTKKGNVGTTPHRQAKILKYRPIKGKKTMFNLSRATDRNRQQ
jgi:hypothetical protein